MAPSYFIRHFNAEGGVLRLQMLPCRNDHEAIDRACGEVLPAGCSSVEVMLDGKRVGKAEAEEFWTEVAAAR